MTKAELLSALSGETGFKKEDVEKVLNSFNKFLVQRLLKDKEVQVLGLGRIKVVHRAERQGKNPANGKPLTIKAKDLPKFSFSKAIKEQVAGEKK